MRVLLQTHGCRANHYDTEQVRALCERAGVEIVATAENADVAVLNSCAVTGEAEADLRQSVRRIARARAEVRVIVTGCSAERSASTIAALPAVTDVIAGADLGAVARALGLPASAAGSAARRQQGARATLRVQDGCDEHCTFCATTLARGAHRSRDLDVVVEEARALADHHPEIVLTGVHVGSWGAESGRTLGTLVSALVREVPRVRFRLASVEATEVDEELAEWLRDGSERVCPYLHAPLQSGSDAVLKRMGRHWYSSERYARAIERLTMDRAVFGLGADLMTGFPGERDADHRATVELVQRLPFTHLHVFPWSARPGTAAERLGGRVPSSLARERAAELRSLGESKGVAYAVSRIGAAADIVVTGAGPRRAGVSEDYLTVAVTDVALARGARFAARLGTNASGRLSAVPIGREASSASDFAPVLTPPVSRR